MPRSRIHAPLPNSLIPETQPTHGLMNPARHNHTVPISWETACLTVQPQSSVCHSAWTDSNCTTTCMPLWLGMLSSWNPVRLFHNFSMLAKPFQQRLMDSSNFFNYKDSTIIHSKLVGLKPLQNFPFDMICFTDLPPQED